MSKSQSNGGSLGYYGVVLVLALLAAGLVWFGIPMGPKVSESINPVDALEPEIAISRDFSWTNDMVWIPSGKFLRGSDTGQTDERPVREISIMGFWMDRTEV